MANPWTPGGRTRMGTQSYCCPTDSMSELEGKRAPFLNMLYVYLLDNVTLLDFVHFTAIFKEKVP